MRYLKRFNESNIECDFYRGVGMDEAIKACRAGHLIYLSKEPMSRDWEVIEYSMGIEHQKLLMKRLKNMLILLFLGKITVKVLT